MFWMIMLLNYKGNLFFSSVVTTCEEGGFDPSSHKRDQAVPRLLALIQQKISLLTTPLKSFTSTLRNFIA